MVGRVIKYVQLLKVSVLKHNGRDKYSCGWGEVDSIELERCNYKQFFSPLHSESKCKYKDNGIAKQITDLISEILNAKTLIFESIFDTYSCTAEEELWVLLLGQDLLM